MRILRQAGTVIGEITRNREINGKKYIDAVVISIAMPDEQSFEGMKHLAEYFFEDMSQEMVTKKAGRKKEQERS
jgi:hypothetical protein